MTVQQSQSPADLAFSQRRPSFDITQSLAREWLSGMNYLFINPRILRRVAVTFLRFLREDVHPWEQDNRYLIDAWVEEHPEPDWNKMTSMSMATND